MGLIAHFQKAALLMLSDRIADTVITGIGDEHHHRVAANLKDLLHFSQRYWFHEVSNQIQAQELFQWWSRHLDTQTLFDSVHREAQEADQHLNTLSQQQQSDLIARLTVIAVLGLALTLITAFWGMNFFWNSMQTWKVIGGLASIPLFFWLVLFMVLKSKVLAQGISDLANSQQSSFQAFRQFLCHIRRALRCGKARNR